MQAAERRAREAAHAEKQREMSKVRAQLEAGRQKEIARIKRSEADKTEDWLARELGLLPLKEEEVVFEEPGPSQEEMTSAALQIQAVQRGRQVLFCRLVV